MRKTEALARSRLDGVVDGGTRHVIAEMIEHDRDDAQSARRPPC